ncbi:hypothetical protein [Geobacter sp. DSM 9736]|uniref:hypothetical protein n=1 Tax=Geobacter sp. DSM 9736 TaxID=1277350 RepID=UPI000B50E32E|nr:hypothetical protein [Geobacter sp. DSM 9736]SNB47766.1 hypothetical protein SAMN06269301_3258 [Geobacter sp. DSM 9736]
MRDREHQSVCNRTERKDERVRLRNIKTGDIGLAFQCTPPGETIQVELEDGSLDSWPATDCEEAR